ncbi:aminoglycoside phosphotransferase family protein [Paenibacillus sp. TAF43_2]|uniref:aminoglycoside phosphotransferase family protein n=1 Tax=Paenibacillus sp. TAF43_2 TaxID=3233069 RepID=UPI003F9A0C01
MIYSLKSIDWIAKNDLIDHLLQQEDNLAISTMDQGFEAEVVKVTLEQTSYVLKIWNKESQPDVGFQFHLLHALFDSGLAVSRPISWGINPNDEKVLFTSFDGESITKVNKKKVSELAILLSSIHQTPLEEMGHVQLSKYDFIGYFYPAINEHADLFESLTRFLSLTQLKQDHIIHGDFHLGNILENNGKYTVIDWTNGQLGDTRYDFAWSFVLISIFVSEQNAHAFRSAYLDKNEISQHDVQLFEAIACLRWVLLSRNGNVPKESKTNDRIKRLISSNPYLKELGLYDYSI